MLTLKSLLLTNNSRISLTVLSFFAFFLFTSITAQNELKDSLDQLINEEVDSEKKLKHITSNLLLGGLTSIEEVNTYFNQGLLLMDSDIKEDLIRRLYEAAGNQLSILGKNELSIQKMNALDSLGKLKNSTFLRAYSLVGLADHDKRLGEFEEGKNKLINAKKMFRSLSNEVGIATCYNSLGAFYRQSGDLNMATFVLDSAIQLLHKDEESSNIIISYSNMGRVYRVKGEHETARKYYLLAAEQAKKLNHLGSISTLYNNLGNIEQISGNLHKSIDYYLKSIDIKQKTANYSGMAVGYHNIGGIELELEDYISAEKYFNQSMDISREIDNKVLIVHNLNKLGRTYGDLNNREKAIKNHKDAAELANEVGFKKGEVAAWYYLGQDYLENQDYKLSIDALQNSLALAKEMGSKPYESAIYVVFSQVYLANKNDQEENEALGLSPIEIERLLLRSKALADEMGNTENQVDALKGLASFYTDNQNYKASVGLLNEFIELNDSLYNAKTFEITKELETKYETSVKEKEILKLESDNAIAKLESSRKSNLLYSMFALFILFGIIGYQFLKYRSKIKAEQEKLSFRDEISTELHDDVGSILTGIAMQSELVAKHVEDKNKDKLNRISNLSRDAMNRMRDIVWALDSQKNKIGDLKIKCNEFAQEILEPNDVQFEFQNFIPEDTVIHPKIRQNLYMITKEAMANVAKHSNAKKLIVNFKKSNSGYLFSIYDNGTSLEHQKAKSGSGLKNMIKRAKNIGGILNTIRSNGFQHNILLNHINQIG